MRGIHIAVATLFLASVPPAEAQSVTGVPFPRADVGGSIGWLNVNKNELDSYDEWYNRSLYGGATGGWYWTEHLKTEVEVGASTTADLYTFEQIVVDGRQTYVSSEARFST
ncbi:MAG: porin family protein, partial [Acidobacteria bacterium]|nr:porin family protein [Acidobacteriota bacterium]